MQPSKGLHNQVVKIVVPYCIVHTCCFIVIDSVGNKSRAVDPDMDPDPAFQVNPNTERVQSGRYRYGSRDPIESRFNPDPAMDPDLQH
jgi:hypothetical protein